MNDLPLHQIPSGESEDSACFFFSHRDCPYFPCHETAHLEDFNCLFCYCPLYTLGEDCGGSYVYTAAGLKDCSHCLLPHGRNSHKYIKERFGQLSHLATKKNE